MIEINKSALVPFAIADVFTVVNDVASYPSYLPGCVSAEVIEQDEGHMLAELCVAKAGVKQAFTTRNRLCEPTEIVMALESGPFSQFDGHWQFKALAEKATKIDFTLLFVMEKQLIAKALESMVADVASQMVDAVCKQLKAVYG